jgi:hypothetical protein
MAFEASHSRRNGAVRNDDGSAVKGPDGLPDPTTDVQVIGFFARLLYELTLIAGGVGVLKLGSTGLAIDYSSAIATAFSDS